MNDLMEQYNSVILLHPQNTNANYRLGTIYYEKKDFVSAIKSFEKNVNLLPQNYNSLLMLAWAKYFNGNTADAKLFFSRVLMLYPTDKSALEGIGMIK